MGTFYVINCPGAFPLVWRLVRPFLDAVVAAKIQIIANRAKWEPVLLAQIGEDALPEDYGGKGPVLSALEHPYAETVEVLAARRVEESSTADLTALATSLATGNGLEETANQVHLHLHLRRPVMSCPILSCRVLSCHVVSIRVVSVVSRTCRPSPRHPRVYSLTLHHLCMNVRTYT